eukprot:1424020-Amphidinium_carterae.2
MGFSASQDRPKMQNWEFRLLNLWLPFAESLVRLLLCRCGAKQRDLFCMRTPWVVPSPAARAAAAQPCAFPARSLAHVSRRRPIMGRSLAARRNLHKLVRCLERHELALVVMWLGYWHVFTSRNLFLQSAGHGSYHHVPKVFAHLGGRVRRLYDQCRCAEAAAHAFAASVNPPMPQLPPFPAAMQEGIKAQYSALLVIHVARLARAVLDSRAVTRQCYMQEETQDFYAQLRYRHDRLDTEILALLTEIHSCLANKS